MHFGYRDYQAHHVKRDPSLFAAVWIAIFAFVALFWFVIALNLAQAFS